MQKKGTIMLRPEITFDDIVLIIFMAIVIVTYYMGYRAGKQDGFEEGSKSRRLAERKIRRMKR